MDYIVRNWIYDEILITTGVTRKGSYLIIKTDSSIPTSYQCINKNRAQDYYELIKELIS